MLNVACLHLSAEPLEDLKQVLKPTDRLPKYIHSHRLLKAEAPIRLYPKTWNTVRPIQPDCRAEIVDATVEDNYSIFIDPEKKGVNVSNDGIIKFFITQTDNAEDYFYNIISDYVNIDDFLV